MAVRELGLPQVEARMLLAHASARTQVSLIAHPEAELPADVAEVFLGLARRRQSGEPVAYLLGEREFYGLSLRVSPGVLIPRPETELLVDLVLERLQGGGSLLDLGTGSGAIALAVKSVRRAARVSACDASEAALAVARANAERLKLEVEFLHGDWYAPVQGRRFSMLASNPPYICASDRHLGEGDLRFEPASALVGGEDGMRDLRTLVAGAGTHLESGGWLVLEHGYDQAGAVQALLLGSGFRAVESRHDLAGIARCTLGQYYPD